MNRLDLTICQNRLVPVHELVQSLLLCDQVVPGTTRDGDVGQIMPEPISLSSSGDWVLTVA